MFQEIQSYKMKDASLTFDPNYMDSKQADYYYEHLLQQVKWEQYHIKMFGKTLPQPRLTAWYGENGAAYAYSGIELMPLPFTAELLLLKNSVEAYTKQEFNSVLLNLYRNQQDSMGWHSDDEKELGDFPFIASLSLGSSRNFQLKHKTDKLLKGKIELNHGSLLCMGGSMQSFWQHAIPKSSIACGPRINLTFRQIKKA
jgi:alkylated DNA repair dioxygenase AlkB